MIDADATNGPTQLLRGAIRNYRMSRRNQDFVFTPGDRSRIGAAAIGAAMVGLGGIAVGLASTSLDTSETADLLEFDLDEKSIRAWVWQSVFQDGDEVEVVAEQRGDVWQGYGIRRQVDEIVALHPHCSRGRYAHWRATVRNFMKWCVSFVFAFTVIFIFYSFLRSTDNWRGVFVVCSIGDLTLLAILGVIAYRMSEKFMGFVKLAEGIFAAFGWQDVKNIDLPALTKKTKQPGDSGVLGVLYFRH